MSVGAQPETIGPSAAGAVGGGARAAGRMDAAGRLLGRLSVLPALLAMTWLLATFPLLLAGHFTPVLALVVSLPLAAGGQEEAATLEMDIHVDPCPECGSHALVMGEGCHTCKNCGYSKCS